VKPDREHSLPPQIEVPYYPEEHPLLAAPGYMNMTFTMFEKRPFSRLPPPLPLLGLLRFYSSSTRYP
jgi:hypothetical protein